MYIESVNNIRRRIQSLYMKFTIWLDNRWKESLYKKYPMLFRQKNLSMRESPMYWGIETGSGWKRLISDMCREIDNLYPNTEFIQIKEKFGVLRVYYQTEHSIDSVYAIVERYENKSETICEQCGKYGQMINTNGWLSVKCVDCEHK